MAQEKKKGFRLLKGNKRKQNFEGGEERDVERGSEGGLLDRRSRNSSHAEKGGRTMGGKGGQKSWEGGEKKEVSRGAEPGVRGFEDDSREMDASEECVSSLYM